MPIEKTYMLWEKPIEKTKQSSSPLVVRSQSAKKQTNFPPPSCVFLEDAPRRENKITNKKIEQKIITNSTAVADKTVVNNIAKKIMPIDTPKGEIERINNTPDDEFKIIRYNRRHPFGNYVVLDKEKASATLYNFNGEKMDSYEIGTGSQKGDALNNGYGKNGVKSQTTPAGEYKIRSRGGHGYGKFIFDMGDEYTTKGSGLIIAMHIIPEQCKVQRAPLFNNGTPSDNRMSAGCINFQVEDFKKMAENVRVGTKVYVLPEENDNYLKLEKRENGQLRFVQNKYRPRTSVPKHDN